MKPLKPLSNGYNIKYSAVTYIFKVPIIPLSIHDIGKSISQVFQRRSVLFTGGRSTRIRNDENSVVLIKGRPCRCLYTAISHHIGNEYSLYAKVFQFKLHGELKKTFHKNEINTDSHSMKTKKGQNVVRILVLVIPNYEDIENKFDMSRSLIQKYLKGMVETKIIKVSLTNL